MPRVPNDALETVVFLYGSRADAESGRKNGASGFTVAHPWSRGFDYHVYVVTSRHCVEGRATTTIRAMRQTDDGSKTVFKDTVESEWILHDDYDVAIYLWKDAKEVAATISNGLLQRSEMESLDIGPGEDVYIVARFIHHDGGQRNVPIVHTGIVSMLPLEPIRNPHTKKNEYDFLVETHSRGGYSGSPVTLYIMPEQVKMGSARNVGPQILILGAMWGHFNTFEPVLDPEIKGDDKTTRFVVRSATMVAGVVPSWEILDLMNGERATNDRDQEEQDRIERSIAATPDTEAVLDSVDTITPTENLMRDLLQVPKDEAED